ncbi:hypothetical protein L1049_024127 [Liquidambar formosana]|uniref:DUF630 domain-containing protein n=1 Tax=Liquidambar formosana TaxID=63359 RepID=A0AAP0S1F5_LIQFO
MGCASSKPGEEDDVVSLCRERKRLMKSAVKRRYALADAHCKYNHSLYAVAAAIRLFATRHSPPLSSFRVSFPSPSDPTETLISNPMFLQQTPCELTRKAIAFKSIASAVSLDSSKVYYKEKEEEEEYAEEEENIEEEYEEEEEVFEHFNGRVGPLMPSPQRDFGWDFFNPFDGVRTELRDGFGQSTDDDLKVIREKEGIPELEEDGEREIGETDNVMVNNGEVVDEEGDVVEEVIVGDENENQREETGFESDSYTYQ